MMTIISMLLPIEYYSKRQLRKLIDKFKKTQTETRIRYLFHLPMFGNVAEIGVANGNFSKCILHISKPLNLHLIDSWEEQAFDYLDDINNVCQSLQDSRYQSVKKKFIKFPQVKIHKGYSLKMAKVFPDHYFDWIYLDANHTYEQVKADLAAWYQKIKPEGIITGNDYTLKPNIGVIRAVDEFMKKHNLEMFLLDNDPWHSFALRKRMNKNKNKLVDRINDYQINLKRNFFRNQKFDYWYTMICLKLRRKHIFS